MSMKEDPRKHILNFAKDNPSVKALKFITNDPEGFEIDDFSAHGMMNTVLRVRSEDHQNSVIIKYGEATARLNPDEDCSLERQVLEYDALELLQEVLPGSSPQPYCLDRNYNIIAMEDMSSWDLLASQLQKSQVDLQAATSLGHLLATLHTKTSQAHVSPQRWEEIKEKYSRDEGKKTATVFLYTRIFEETDPWNKIPAETLETYRRYNQEIRAMKLPEKLTELFDAKDCFIHSDCHWKSVFVKDGKAALLDFEFSFLGPAAQNVATPFMGYLFCYNDEDKDKEKTPDRHEFKKNCVQAVCNILTAYMDTHPDLRDMGQRTKFLKDVALFTGAALLLFGTYIAMDEFEFLTDTNRTFLLTRGFEVMKAHEDMSTVEEFLKVLFKV